jgi:hypothetical protein
LFFFQIFVFFVFFCAFCFCCYYNGAKGAKPRRLKNFINHFVLLLLPLHRKVCKQYRLNSP